MVLIIKVVRQICSSCAAVKWITLRGIYLDSFSVSFVHHPCHWHPCCDRYLAASKIQTLCKSSEGTIVNFKETWMWKEVNIIKTKTKTKTKGSLDTKKKTDRLKELCINEVQLPPIKQILSEKRDFFSPLDISNSLYCWETARDSQSCGKDFTITDSVQAQCEKSPSHKTTKRTKARGRENVSLKHLHVGRYNQTGPTASVNRVRL